MRVFQGITEEARFENGEDSDNGVDPFYEVDQDEEYDEGPILSYNSNPDPSTNNQNIPPLFTRDELIRRK